MIQNATSRIHRARPEDVVRVCALAEEFYEADAMRYHPCGIMDADVWVGLWSEAIRLERGVILYCTDSDQRDGKPIGFIVAMLVNSPVDGELDLTEFLWFVSENATGAPCGMALLAALEDFAQEAGAVRVNMCHMANRTGMRIGRIFSRWGYAPVEVAYTKRIGGK
jgi:GNAT superfamily N-acetyltransferase